MQINSNNIVITGLGLLTGLGLDLASSWQGICDGASHIKPFTLFDSSNLQCAFGVELSKNADLLFKSMIKTRNRRQMTRGTMMAISTAVQAVENSKLDMNSLDKSRIGIVVGCTGTGYCPIPTKTDPNHILKDMVNAPAAWIGLKWKIQGPAFSVSTACSSGTYAIYSAIQLILSGQCDIVITGGFDSVINYPYIEGFSSIMALSDDVEHMQTASRPFDKNRCGFVMGEGCGMLILESREHANRRDAKMYASVSLPGISSEAYNILSPCPQGKGMARTMRIALDNAGLKPEDIDYINAHGTSTILNDLYETEAIKNVFGKYAYNIPISSTKSMTGHCLSGAAAVEAVIACKSLEENIIPPTMNLTNPDPKLDLDYVPLKTRKKILKHIMSNSFAFGGHNGACIFSKTEEL